MARIKVKQIDGICKKHYDRNLKFFFESFPKLKYVEEINKGIIEEFVGQLMDRGNRVTAINARLRAIHVFLRYCFEQE